MSYILDALRRAQAERERGQVPGLAAQPGLSRTAAAAPRVSPTAWLVFGLGGGLAVGLLVAVGVWAGRGAPERPAGPPTVAFLPPPTSAVAGPAAPQQVPASAPLRMPVVVSAPPPALPVTPPPTVQVAQQQQGRDEAPPPRLADAPARLPAPAATPAPAPVFGGVVVTPPARSAPGASAAEPDPVLLAQLPPAQRRELPALSVGGVIWSESPASRFVILDGQVVREGGSVATGVTLERIERQSAVLRWRGGRVRLPL